MPELIDRQEVLEIAMSYCPDDDGCCSKAGHDIREMLDEIEALPTIKPEVRHWKGCEYCKGRSYTKKPLTVITRTMKSVEVCFNFCPNCGRDMRSTGTNVGGKGGADNG